MKSYKYIIKNLECANCAKKIETKISNTDGYSNVVLNFATQKLSFQTEKQNNVKEEIQQIVLAIEPSAIILDEKEPIKAESIKNDVIRLIIRHNIICDFYANTNGEYITYNSDDTCLWCIAI